MLWVDLPLIVVSALFLVLGFLYGWGLLRWFRDDFRWSYASVMGILSVVSVVGTLVWYPRYGDLAWELVWSLFVPFSTALAGMLWVDRVLRQDRALRDLRLAQLEERVLEQDELLEKVEQIIDRHEQRAQERIDEIIRIFRMEQEAHRLMEHLNHLN